MCVCTHTHTKYMYNVCIIHIHTQDYQHLRFSYLNCASKSVSTVSTLGLWDNGNLFKIDSAKVIWLHISIYTL